MDRRKIDWQRISLVVGGAILSLSLWFSNKVYGQFEQLQAQVQDLKQSRAAANEVLLYIRADQHETLERVKNIEKRLERP